MTSKENDMFGKKSGIEEQIKCLNCETVVMKKVRCGRELMLDQCPDCGGIWFDGRELIDLVDLGEFYIKSLDDSKKIRIEINRIRKCPRCNVVLAPAKFQNTDIKVDRCPDCKGMWLDRGELESISKMVKN